MRTAELIGADLDYWVARAEGLETLIALDTCLIPSARRNQRIRYSPSSSWEQGGLLVEKYKMYIEYDADGYWVAAAGEGRRMQAISALEVICRAVVQSVFGDKVQA